MMGIPKHLKGIFHPTDTDGTEGDIICECGCDTFGIRYFGENEVIGNIGLSKYNGKYALTVHTVCRNCGKEWEIFDFVKHGFDGVVNDDGNSVPESELIDAAAGEERDFKVKMSIELFDEDVFLEEFVEEPPEGMSFTPEDRFDIWSWVVIDLKCSKSGLELMDFVNIELA